VKATSTGPALQPAAARGIPAGDGRMAVTDHVETWSLLLDLTILQTTVAVALRGSRAP
jgi:hypothetical protein